MAGVLYTKVEIHATGGYEFTTQYHPTPALKMVLAVTDRTRCNELQYETTVAKVDSVNSSDLARPTRLYQVSTVDQGLLETQLARVMFQHGGVFKLCYTPDGTFSEADGGGRFNNVLNVIGVITLLLATESRAVCDTLCAVKISVAYYMNEIPTAACSVVVTNDPAALVDGQPGREGWSMTAGGSSRLYWSEAFEYPDIHDMNGTLKAGAVESSKSCATTAPDMVYIQSPPTTGMELLTTKAAVLPTPRSSSHSSFAFAACYCPSYGDCDDASEYTQQVGVFYMWTLRICDLGDERLCTPRYMRFFPQQNFALRVDCPPGAEGCLNIDTDQSRISFLAMSGTLPEVVRQAAVDPTQLVKEKMNWDPTHVCKTTVESRLVVIREKENLNGGPRRDYRVWGEFLRIRRTLNQRVAVCMCQRQCDRNSNWFKVGEISTPVAVGFSFRSNTSSSYTQQGGYQPYGASVSIVNVPGKLTLYFGNTLNADTADAYEAPKASRSALVNILSFDRDLLYGPANAPGGRKTLEGYLGLDRETSSDAQTKLDEICEQELYSPIIRGPDSKQTAKDYIAHVPWGTVTNYLSFDGQLHDKEITVLKSGVIGVCYCAEITSSTECADQSWIFTGRMLIRGPVGGQVWNFPVDVIVGLSLDGWGLDESRDFIRIVGSSENCEQISAANPEPSGITTILLGCPAENGAGCRAATETTNLVGHLLGSHDTAGVHLHDIVPEPTKTLLSFDGEHGLSDGDMILIEEETLEISGKLSTFWTESQKYVGSLITGQTRFRDNTSVSYPVGHRVMLDPANPTTQVYIPVAIPTWLSTDFLSFKSQLGRWRRISEWSTKEEIRATVPYSGAKVCWATRPTGSHLSSFMITAGTINFVEPPEFPHAMLSLTSTKAGAVAPVILTFQAGSWEYSLNDGPITLVLRFRDVVDTVTPLLTADVAPDGLSPTGLPASEELPRAQMKQSVCGKIFTELWSSDPSGFPIPAGCYYSKTYRNDGANEKFYREYYISFNQKYGLRHDCSSGKEKRDPEDPTTKAAGGRVAPSSGPSEYCTYQIAFLASVSDLVTTSSPVMDIYSICHGCAGSKYKVFEKSAVYLDRVPIAAAGFSDSNFKNGGGFVLRNGDEDRILALSTSNVINFRLEGGSGASAIKKGSTVRLILSPLTLWHSSSTCFVGCTADSTVSDAVCVGPEMTCSMESSVLAQPGGDDTPGRKLNVVKITLPSSSMTDITGDEMHDFTLSGLTLPSGGTGWFPTRIGVEITEGGTDLKPDYTTSNGFIWKDHGSPGSNGRILVTDYSGYGPKPFKEDTSNKLVVRLQFAVPLLSLGQASAVDISIFVPDEVGVSCRTTDGAVVRGDLEVFEHDLDDDYYFDNVKGYWSGLTDDGSWESSSANECIYSFRKGQMVPVNATAFLTLTLDNPRPQMKRDDEINTWFIQLGGKGYSDASPRRMSKIPFTGIPYDSVEARYWQHNTAALGELTEVTLQPLSFQPDAMTYLRVFFITTTAPNRRSKIVLDAPDGFDFGEDCDVQELPSAHYAVVSATAWGTTNRLKFVEKCIGSKFSLSTAEKSDTFNRATIVVGGVMKALTYYGFQIGVTLPSGKAYNPDIHNYGWRLWTYDEHGYGLDGARPYVRFNLKVPGTMSNFYDKGFGLYADEIEGIKSGENVIAPTVRMASLMPFTVAGASTWLTFEPFVFRFDFASNMRLTAPIGYVWDRASSFQVSSPYSDTQFPALPDVENPGSENELLFSELLFQGGKIYGFAAKAIIPDVSPTTSTNAFFLEIGYTGRQITERYASLVIEAPLVSSLIDCTVSYLSAKEGYIANLLVFSFYIVTPLVGGDGLIIKGDDGTKGFTFEQVCNPVEVDGSQMLPAGGIVCKAIYEQGVPRITLTVGEGFTLSTGLYKLEMPSANPDTPRVAGKWTFGTYKKVSDFPNVDPIDKSMTIVGYDILLTMTKAAIVPLTTKQRSLTGRNDRPEKVNNIIVAFRISSTPTSEQDFIIRAPRGFVFDDDCLPGIVTSSDLVFGDADEFNEKQYRLWDDEGARPLLCIGEGRTAYLTFSLGIERDSTYAFRFQVKNPTVTPEVNLWNLEYNGFASFPLEGFSLWTFTGTTLNAVSTSTTKDDQGGQQNNTAGNPVSVVFTPTRTIIGKLDFSQTTSSGNRRQLQINERPNGGTVAIDAPSTFTFSNPCNVALATNDASVIFTAGLDFDCSVESDDDGNQKLTVELIGTRSIQEGIAYDLTFYVVNPLVAPDEVSPWLLRSFDIEGNALDEVPIPGYKVVSSMRSFQVINPTNTYKGTFKVSNVIFKSTFPEALMDGDLVQFSAPGGFDLRGLTAGSCNEYVASPLITTSPSCQCSTTGCSMTFLLKEGNTPALSEGALLEFTVTTVNPIISPPLMKSFWKVSHKRGSSVRTSDSVEGWEVISQLTGVGVDLIGAHQSAGSFSDIEVTFVSVSAATILRIEAVAPSGFNFINAQVEDPSEILPYDLTDEEVATGAVRNFIFLSNLDIVPGAAVRLGDLGGQTVFTLETYKDSSTMDDLLDESRGFNEGFKLPGRVIVPTAEDDPTGAPRLSSTFAEKAWLYPVKSLLGARVDEEARAIFPVTFTQNVYAKEKLIIGVEMLMTTEQATTAGGQTSTGATSSTATDPTLPASYELKSRSFSIKGSTTTVQTATSIDKSTGNIEALLLGHDGQVVLSADETYEISMTVVPKSGEQKWRIYTQKTGESLPSNTNDGDTQGFSPVLVLGMTVTPLRKPPRAEIEVDIKFDVKQREISALTIIAPEGFSFPPEGCGPICFPEGEWANTKRKVAVIRNTVGVTIPSEITNSPIRITAITPDRSPASLDWVFQADDRGGTPIGWAEGTGFQIDQMSNVKISYAGVSSAVTTQNTMVWFAVSFDVSAGGASQIVVVQPKDYKFRCSDAAFVKSLSLPGGHPECTEEYPLTLTLYNSTLDIGSYAFTVRVQNPATTPVNNTFDVLVKSSDGKVVDAAFGVPGLSVVRAHVVNPFVYWSSSIPSSTSRVQIGFEVKSTVDMFKAILITLPPSFVHLVGNPTEVINNNKDFPVASGTGWADVSNSNAVKILMDDTTALTVVSPGKYSWTFPIRLPRVLPAKNIWFISFCESRQCSSHDGDDVVVDHPIPGFEFYEKSPAGGLTVETGAAAPGVAPPLIPFTLFVLCYFFSISLS
ncbi:protein arginine methyltransferase 10 [Perkinsus chesapeaki]|uniref:Protein arginine methyltransferase 10 n=1 Tax=Perkinsus chesapeaki TaxID=330153 RepID=A0A7J6MKV3_PERCH|nr:protein arginine methyltransferase 10 [Perkinsus chesapeaki]